MLCVALYFDVGYASCSMCMYCNVLLVNQCAGESLVSWGRALEPVFVSVGFLRGFLPLVTGFSDLFFVTLKVPSNTNDWTSLCQRRGHYNM